MRLNQQVKSITYLKNNTGEVMERLEENGQPYVITQNGEAKAVLLNVRDYDEKMETIAMLKRLVISAKQRDEGKYRPMEDVFGELMQSNTEDE